MAVLAPLSAPDDDPRLSALTIPGLSWWLLWDTTAGGLSGALAEVAARLRDPKDASWVLVVEGSRDRVRYVAAAVDGPGTPSQRAGSRAVLGPVAPADLVTILDRTETAPVSTEMFLVASGDVAGTVRGLGDGRRPPADVTVHAILANFADDLWAAIALPDGGPPQAPGVAVLRTPQPLPRPLPAGERARSRRVVRRGAILATVLAGGVVAAAVLLAVRQQSPVGGSAPSPSPPATAAPSGQLLGSPQPVNAPAFAFDPDRREVVMFGGSAPGATTWLWTADRSWSVAMPSSAPPDRFGEAMAYDPVMKRVVLFGGRLPPGELVNDTWVWDGSSWAHLATSGVGEVPPGWEFSGMAWDEARRQLVLVTPPNVGFAGGSAVTWTWDGQSWGRRQSAANPPAEPSSSLAFDPVTRTVLLVLGGLSPGASPSTWSWNGNAWRQLHPAHQPGLGGFTSFLARVPNAQQLVLTRLGIDSPQTQETWTWNGRDWTQEHPAQEASGLVGLLTTDRGVIAIGRTRRDLPLVVWLWTGATWTRI